MGLFENTEWLSFFSNIKGLILKSFTRKRGSSIVPYQSEVDGTLSQLNIIACEDTNFDKFTSLAKRLFNVPLAIVYLSDSNTLPRKKSLIYPHLDGNVEDGKETPEQLRFFVDLPQGRTVSVINDGASEIRLNSLKHAANVVGAPYVFYAGVALLVDNKKIGTLFIVDHKRHKKFSVDNQNILLDLGAAISSMIKDRMEAYTTCSNEAATMMVDMMHNLRTPLTALNMTTAMLLENHEEKQIKQPNNITNLTDVNEADSMDSVLLQGLDSAVGELKVV